MVTKHYKQEENKICLIGCNLPHHQFDLIKQHYPNMLFKDTTTRTHNSSYLLSECATAQKTLLNQARETNHIILIGDVLPCSADNVHNIQYNDVFGCATDLDSCSTANGCEHEI